MAAPDMEVIKDIPGYKVILKAIIKAQIQQLVEQLAAHTDEESVILTASVADGTLSHLGSDSGKGFLEEQEDVKTQFLGFCLKNVDYKTMGYMCTLCGKSFRSPSMLTRHMLVHTGEMPYQCTKCGKRFNQKSSMKRHQIVHLNVNITV
ncbi:zinc finger protein 2-like [Ruditapes philippinarum]|uniref:zinc finger protein 2-like n=1 Tax=Ruditapes philippinarum TaxID=129788 RepID=UPI00295B838B|nr:zinc finger protein 2-like [Ruditapes philippinarum]